MRVVGLISGGKDSCYNLMQCIASGHMVVALANIEPHNRTELDSYMYQSVGHEAIEHIAESMRLPLFRVTTRGTARMTGLDYSPTEDDEVEDLYEVLNRAKSELNVEAVSVGAIFSDYQRLRVENVCSRLQLVPLAYLWRRDQNELLHEMLKCEVDAIIVKVAALGLDPSRHLGRSLRLVEPHLQTVHEKYGINVCGEGGEYETLVLDCPLYNSRLVIENSEVVLQSDDPIAPVGYWKINKMKLEEKTPHLNVSERLSTVPLKDSDGYVTDQGEEATEFMTEEEDEIDNENSFSNSHEEVSSCSFQQSTTYCKSNDGWLNIGGIVGKSDNCQDATKEALEKLKSALAVGGHRLENLCSVTVYVSDMAQFAQINKTYVDLIKHTNPPSRACVQVPLPKDCHILMSAVSWSPINEIIGDLQTVRTTLHVQSVSHWAPANIGPYSQAVQVGELIHLSGIIGLVPGSMELVKGGIKYQSQLSVKHMGRILNAIDSNVNLRDVVQGVCYLTNIRHIDQARKCWETKTNNAIVDYVIVNALPRGALVEWHVWAHKHNSTFEFEETGKCVDDWSISIYRRWNLENNIAAIMCQLHYTKDSPQQAEVIPSEICQETFEYVLCKLQQGHDSDGVSACHLKVFYSVRKLVSLESISEALDRLCESRNLVYTLIPVLDLHTKQTYLSVCGFRVQ